MRSVFDCFDLIIPKSLDTLQNAAKKLAMDIVTHAATGLLLSTAFDDPTAKTLCIVGSVIPDITVAPIYTEAFWKTKSLSKGVQLIRDSGEPDSPFATVFFKFYWAAHSILPISIVSILAYLTNNGIMIAFCLGYLSHLVWDIPTHTKRYACRPFYPLSEYTWNGFGDWWRTHTGLFGMLTAWMLLFGSYFYMS